ncbi:hypothetical protein DFA_10691 [Cavenderia fasciculata]|uniref:Uncharacterized protein n=1 Tax=Cavenderia fasciculata TaxID=261658 RepID=F4QB46_CACFS|nr:uncharacterized protein DFA_10691 [Cavenderia fasciculata]EGG14818.1 hypothetical protein DFA_10691 [Cavenderia fasciculata]|eukprot:XP_004351334.1 hypothetical protein DFA_10691 [Cavenderia fasciculata]
MLSYSLSQETTTAHNDHSWGDIQYRYSPNEDILMIYFIKIEENMIDVSDEILDGIVADFNEEQKITSLEIMNASFLLNCHFYDLQSSIEGRAPFSLSYHYNQPSDTLIMFFTGIVNVDGSLCKEIPAMFGYPIDSYFIGRCLAALEFHKASTSIKKTNVEMDPFRL